MLRQRAFYKLFGQRLRELREARGISREELATTVTLLSRDPERERNSEERIRCIGAAARQLRIEKALTQSEVAGRGKLPLPFVEAIEANELRDVEIYAIYQLSVGLGVSLGDFYVLVEKLHGSCVP